MKAIEKFHELEQGVLGIVKAADIYAVHTMANIRNEAPNMDVITSILLDNKISGLNLSNLSYKKVEIELLGAEGNFTAIGQQIIVAAHTALESYLILKFREYYRFLCSDLDEKLVEATLKLFNFRCLDDFKEAYKKFLGIHLPSFDVRYYSSDDCSFQPSDSWQALNLIYEARNNIVHKGKSIGYQVSTLMDSWYPFEFVRTWVSLFDVNFDFYIFQKKETSLYREHKDRANSAGVLI